MDCFSIPETDYTDFSKSLHAKAMAARTPISGSIELTERCNLRCRHCYINLPIDSQAALDRELKAEQWFGIIDQLVASGCLWLLFTGGEAVIRPDFPEIYDYAKRKGLLISLFSNGTAITSETADHLVDRPPFSIEITLYGATRDTYERVTGINGSYDRCIRGIDLLLERGLPVKLKALVTTLNVHEVRQMKAFAKVRGLLFTFDPVVNVRPDGGHGPAEFRISAREVAELDLADDERMKQWKRLWEDSFGPLEQPDRLFNCLAGQTSFHINPYGRLMPCTMCRGQDFDLCTGTFEKGWTEVIAGIVDGKREKSTECTDCEIVRLCSQCPGWAEIEHGDRESVVEYLCDIAHSRAEAFGMNPHMKETDRERRTGIQG